MATSDGSTPLDRSPVALSTSPPVSLQPDTHPTRIDCGDIAGLDLELLERRVHAAEATLESVTKQVHDLASAVEKVMHMSAIYEDKGDAFQSIVASLQGNLATLEKSSRRQLEDLASRATQLEEHQTLLAQEVASGALTENSVTRFFSQAIQQAEAQNAMEQMALKTCIQELTQALKVESITREEEVARVRLELLQGKTRVGTGTATPVPMKQHLRSRLAEIDTDMQTLKSQLSRSGDGSAWGGNGARSPVRPSVLSPDSHHARIGRAAPFRGDASPSEPSRLSPSASRVMTASNTRAHSRERDAVERRVVTTPWSNFVPFAQNKLTWAGNTTVVGPPVQQVSSCTPQAALNGGSPGVPQGIASPGGVPQGIASAGGCSPNMPLGDIVATAGPPPGGLSSPTRVASVRPLQDQRVSQVR